MKRADVLHWTPADYLSEYKVRRLGLREHGAYHLLLWHMWEATDEQCIFPLDYHALGGIWGVCAEEAQEIADELMAPGMPLFKIVNRSRIPHLFSKRLSEQADEAHKVSARQSVKGHISGRVRAELAANRGSTVVQPDGEPDVNPNEPSYLVSRKHVSDKTLAHKAPSKVKPEDVGAGDGRYDKHFACQQCRDTKQVPDPDDPTRDIPCPGCALMITEGDAS